MSAPTETLSGAGSSSSSSTSRRMPLLSAAPTTDLVLPISPARDGDGNADPTLFKLVPQSPVFSDGSNVRDEVVDIQAHKRNSIW